MNPIETKHKDYQNQYSSWSLARDVVEGQDAIHGAGEDYLPKLEGMTESQYEAYVERTQFFNASGRTVDGMTGLAIRKEADAEFPGSMESFFNDVDHKGTKLDDYVQNTIEEGLTIGFGGTLIDYPIAPDGLTKAEAEALNLNPIWAYYKAESIFNWRFELIDNAYKLTFLVLHETSTEDDPEEEFENITVERYRVCKLVEGVYIQEIYVVEDTTDDITLESSFTPGRNDESISHIPFVFHTVGGKDQLSKPPLKDLFDLNVKHYQLKADHKHALHYVALPTPYIAGMGADDENAPTAIGPQRLWLIPDSSASVGMLEFTGAGISSIENELASIELQMAQLGSRMLAPDSSKIETATATEIKVAGETSTLAAIVRGINRQITEAMAITAGWMGVSDDVSFSLNTDYNPESLSGSDIVSLVTAWQAGAFSKETLFYNLQKGEVIPGSTEFEDEEEKIADETEPDEENDFDDTDVIEDGDSE